MELELTAIPPYRYENRRFVMQGHWNGLRHVALGIELNLQCPFLELRLPFGFVRIGWLGKPVLDGQMPKRFRLGSSGRSGSTRAPA